MRKATQRKRRKEPAKGRRFTAAQRQEAMKLIKQGLTREEVASVIGTTTESLRRWKQSAAATVAAATAAVMSAPAEVSAGATVPAAHAPVGPGTGLSPVEVEAIVELKKEHPSMGPAQIRAQLKRFRGWRLSVKAIASVLRRHGYRLVHTGSRPEGDEAPQRFEAPRRNALWQMDFCEVRVGPERRFVLFVLDDHSRFIVGHALCAEPSSEVAVATLKAAMATHGKAEAVYTDRGGAFLAWRDRSGFQRHLEAELIEHHVSRPYRPQGRGKVEALIGTMQRELWNVRHFSSVAEAERALARWVYEYNHRRAHMGLDGLVPADRFFGRAEAVRAALAARVRGRETALVARAPEGAPVEEEIGGADALEVFRLCIVDGRAELRLFGARIPLGQVAQ